MIRKLSHRIVWVLVVSCLAVSGAADPYHPDIHKSYVVTLDTAAIERWADSGTPFDLTLGGKTLSVVLAPAPVFPEEGVTFVVIGKDGKETQSVVQGNFTYAGEILGDDPATAEVRLTIAGGVLEGYVLTGTDWWILEPLARFDPKAGSDQYLVYLTSETGVAIDFGDDDLNVEVIDHLIKGEKIPLAMVVDREYFFQSGESLTVVMQRHAAVVNGVNGIYKMQLGREFRVPAIVVDHGVHLTGTHIIDLMYQLKLFITPQKLVQLQSQIAHLTTAKALDFGAHGHSVQRGFHSLSKQSTTLDFRNTILAARFIGANFEAVPVEAEEYTIGGQIWRRTLEHRTFDSATTIPRFSDGRHGPDFNNVQRMCFILAERGFPCR